MPETREEVMRNVQWAAEEARLNQARARDYTAGRDMYIRQAYAAGATYHELAKATGLSRAQVARICDLSKDRGES